MIWTRSGSLAIPVVVLICGSGSAYQISPVSGSTITANSGSDFTIHSSSTWNCNGSMTDCWTDKPFNNKLAVTTTLMDHVTHPIDDKVTMKNGWSLSISPHAVTLSVISGKFHAVANQHDKWVVTGQTIKHPNKKRIDGVTRKDPSATYTYPVCPANGPAYCTIEFSIAK